MIFGRILLLPALLAGMVACGEVEKPRPEEPQEPISYANLFPLRCHLFTSLKVSAVQTDTPVVNYVWGAEDSPVALDVARGVKVGMLELQSGVGSSNGLFTLMTDLNVGDKCIIMFGAEKFELPAEQTSVPGSGIPGCLSAFSEPVTISGKMTECTLSFPFSILDIEISAPNGTPMCGAELVSVTIGSQSGLCGAYKVDADGIKPLDDASHTLVLRPSERTVIGTDACRLSATLFPNAFTKEGSIRVEAKDKDGKTTTMTATVPARPLSAGRMGTLTFICSGSEVVPADKTKPEFTFSTVEYKKTAEASSYSRITNNLAVDGMNWMPKLTVPTLDRWGGYDGVKPDEVCSKNPVGFWRTGKYKGHWVMVNPDGNVTILHGVNGVTPDRGKEISTVITRANYDNRFSSTTEWVQYANRVLVDYGFNFYSSNPNRIRRTREFISEDEAKIMHHYTGDAQLGEVSLAYLLRTFQYDYNHLTGVSPNTNEASVFTLMFDPGYLEFIDLLAKDAADLYRDDVNFIGYYTDNELQFRWASDSTPGIWLHQWIALPVGTGHPRANKYAREYAENFMKTRYSVEPLKANITAAMEEAFLEDISDYYYKTATEALRRYDPNHLIIGSRLHGKPKTLKAVHQACAKYCDVVSVNLYGVWEPDDTYFKNNFVSWTGGSKPFFITEFYTRDATLQYEGKPYANTGEGGGWIVKGQHPRGLHYQNFTRKAITYDHCIGWQWFQFTDDDLDGYGWNNKGLISPKYVPYTGVLEMMRQLHWNIYQILDYYYNPEGASSTAPENVNKSIWEY